MKVSFTAENDLATLQELRASNSCGWFTEGDTFLTWSTTPVTPSPILWLAGPPAMGKSVACSHAVGELQGRNALVSYFFFKHGKQGNHSPSDCLLSLALQMALQDSSVMECIHHLEDQGILWDSEDDRAIWRKLFVAGILKLPSVSRHIWVLDALDESANPAFLSKLATQLPPELRVIVASRPTADIERGMRSLGSRVRTQTLAQSDTGTGFYPAPAYPLHSAPSSPSRITN